jgi:hypothetical protein
MNLVRLHTINGPMWIDTRQLNTARTHLTIYTRAGRKLSETARTAQARENASYGVHRDNLFASPELAEANHARILASIYNPMKGANHGISKSCN